MKLRNKKTGEIVKVNNLNAFVHTDEETIIYNSLAELNAEWEDYEEPKDFWFIDPEIIIACESTDPLLCDKKVAIETMKQIGNYFETKEEAEKAVEKLKAWKRLKDKGFTFIGVDGMSNRVWFTVNEPYTHIANEYDNEYNSDLDLLFGGEE